MFRKKMILWKWCRLEQKRTKNVLILMSDALSREIFGDEYRALKGNTCTYPSLFKIRSTSTEEKLLNLEDSLEIHAQKEGSGKKVSRRKPSYLGKEIELQEKRKLYS
nr:hypothetical protein Iba_chr01aCG17570 [Ipomoea batatas]